MRKDLQASIEIRPIRRTDTSGLMDFHQRLSDHTVYMRYMGFMSLRSRIARVQAEVPRAVEHPDAGTWLVAIYKETGEIVGYGELIRLPAKPNTAEIALTVRDDLQGRRIGTSMVKALLARVPEKGISYVTASVLRDNTRVRRLLTAFGFTFHSVGGGEMEAELELA